MKNKTTGGAWTAARLPYAPHPKAWQIHYTKPPGEFQGGFAVGTTKEKMDAYIQRTGIFKETRCRYCMTLGEMRVIRDAADENIYEAICLAFDFGRAKGYRAARAKGKVKRIMV